MALHGSIEVNNERIGYWVATRIVTADPNVYRCEVDSLKPDGSAFHQEFQLTHRFEDGAIALAALVLQAAIVNFRAGGGS